MGSLGTNTAAAGFSAFAANGKAPFEPLNPQDVRAYLHKAVDFISDYYTNIESMPVLPASPTSSQATCRASSGRPRPPTRSSSTSP
jgi:hypothetical protein